MMSVSRISILLLVVTCCTGLPQPVAHPRLHLLDEDLPLIHQAIKSDPIAASWYELLKKQADALVLDNKTIQWNPGSILQVSRTALFRIPTLAGIFRLTGNSSYAERALLEMRAAANFTEWDPASFLDTAEMTNAISIGYDWLYNMMSDADRLLIETAVYNKAFHFGMEFYTGNYTHDPIVAGSFDWTNVDFNWNQVCNGGLMVGAIAFWEVYPDTTAQILQYALKNLPSALSQYGPDGGWVEGPMYWNYATSYLSYFLGSAISAFGNDFGLTESFPYIGLTGNFRIHTLSPGLVVDNWGDCQFQTGYEWAMIFLGRIFNSSTYIAHERIVAVVPQKAPIFDIPNILHLFYTRSGDTETQFPPANYAMDSYFRQVEVLTSRTTWAMWTKDPYTYVGLKGGDTTQNHQDLDLGNFIIEKNGQRFVVDLGEDNYELANYFVVPERYQYYRTNTSGQNTLTFNGQNNQNIIQSRTTNVTSTPTEFFATLNLTEAYLPNATSVFRSLNFNKIQNTIIVTDEITPNENTKIVHWRFHTQAQTVNVTDNKATLHQNNQMLNATILSPAGATWNLYPFVFQPPQYSAPDLQVLEIEYSADEKMEIVVLFQ